MYNTSVTAMACCWTATLQGCQRTAEMSKDCFEGSRILSIRVKHVLSAVCGSKHKFVLTANLAAATTRPLSTYTIGQSA